MKYFEAQKLTEQHEAILDALSENGGTCTWTELCAIMRPGILHSHLRILINEGTVFQDNAESNGQIVTRFYLRRR